ncbi:hypothetical protein DPMN_039175 [Dreissena polymorpha]|uniref:Uncharacterized protein n=1 Tax=Dreissena polymorpha TaxID=45954 RepID=A0A9D4RR28_DREPO|nr:hypothetical protein DPMN_039175 [Dreissena polymorpha]
MLLLSLLEKYPADDSGTLSNKGLQELTTPEVAEGMGHIRPRVQTGNDLDLEAL